MRTVWCVSCIKNEMYFTLYPIPATQMAALDTIHSVHNLPTCTSLQGRSIRRIKSVNTGEASVDVNFLVKSEIGQQGRGKKKRHKMVGKEERKRKTTRADRKMNTVSEEKILQQDKGKV